jgi:hypothetical protein
MYDSEEIESLIPGSNHVVKTEGNPLPPVSHSKSILLMVCVCSIAASFILLLSDQVSPATAPFSTSTPVDLDISNAAWPSSYQVAPDLTKNKLSMFSYKCPTGSFVTEVVGSHGMFGLASFGVKCQGQLAAASTISSTGKTSPVTRWVTATRVDNSFDLTCSVGYSRFDIFTFVVSSSGKTSPIGALFPYCAGKPQFSGPGGVTDWGSAIGYHEALIQFNYIKEYKVATVTCNPDELVYGSDPSKVKNWKVITQADLYFDNDDPSTDHTDTSLVAGIRFYCVGDIILTNLKINKLILLIFLPQTLLRLSFQVRLYL